MPQAQTKVLISAEVPEGCTRPMANQMPTPVIAPSTRVTSMKKRVWRRV